MFDVEEVPEVGPALVVKQVSSFLTQQPLCNASPIATPCLTPCSTQLVKGGSAQLDGSIAVGDIVTRIDSADFDSSVCTSSDSALSAVKEVTSGLCGSTLLLHVFRPSDDRKFEVTLTRGNAQSVMRAACSALTFFVLLDCLAVTLL